MPRKIRVLVRDLKRAGPDTEGEILVATADDKGEKANKKQMAYVGAVYSINRFPRSAADVVDEVCRKQRAEHRSTPQNKQVWAGMTRCLLGSGVAEGACRHLVKDRMEGTGMRWTVPGAQARLRHRDLRVTPKSKGCRMVGQKGAECLST